MNDLAVTIKDVAQAAGVAPSTVSKVLSGSGSLADSTRERVLAAMEQLGYRPNAAARSLVTGQSQAIGVVVNRTAQLAFANPFFVEVLRSVGEVAEHEGFSLVVRTGADSAEEEQRALELLRTRMAAGMIIPSARVSDHLLAELQRHRYPFVVIGRPDSTDPTIPWVNTDNVGDSCRATRLLIERGHRQITLMSGSSRLTVNQDRQAGYRQAMAEAGLTPDVLEMGYSLNEAHHAIDKWLDTGPGATAMLCTDDLKALGAYKALAERRMAIPEQMALLTFNDVALAELLNPPLSCIHVPFADLGNQAATMLFALLRGEELATRQVILPTRFISRGSC